jgi:hypothetical protein
MKFFRYILAEVFTSTAVLWSAGSLVATIVTGELFGVALNIGILAACIWLVVYEAVTGKKRNLPFGVLVLSSTGTLISVAYKTLSTVGMAGVLAPTQATMDAITYAAARLVWIIASLCVVLTTNIPKLAAKPIFNHMVYYSLGCILAVQGSVLATLILVAAMLRALIDNRYNITVTSAQLAGLGCLVGGMALAAHTPFLAISCVFWAAGHFAFDRTRNLALFGLSMPQKPV